MLWYKGWLETRFRLLFVCIFHAVLLIALSVVKPSRSSPFAALDAREQIKAIARFGFPVFVAAIASLNLAGAGINTQAAFQESKGLHGSTLLTLSLPVSRLRLLAVRAVLGWVETAGFVLALYIALWVASPSLRNFRPAELAGYALTLVGCSLSIYAVPLLFATFLGDLGRILGSAPALGVLWWVLNRQWVPPALNIFRAMGENSPLFAHTLPWPAIVLSLSLSAAVFLAALHIVRRREY